MGNIEGLPPTVALEQSKTSGGARSIVGTFSTLSSSVRLLYSRCGDYAEGVRERNGGRLDSDAFSPNTTAGMCPKCQGTGVVHRPVESTMVPDPSKSINEGAIAAWPGAWAGKNFLAILDALDVNLDSPWQDLDQKDRDWILFTDERPMVTISPVRGADQIRKTYKGTWKSVANCLTDTLHETHSDALRRRVLSYMNQSTCDMCDGRRLTPDALLVTYASLPIDALTALPMDELLAILDERFDPEPKEGEDARDEAERLLLSQLVSTLRTVVELGIEHLSLDRPAAQRHLAHPDRRTGHLRHPRPLASGCRLPPRAGHVHRGDGRVRIRQVDADHRDAAHRAATDQRGHQGQRRGAGVGEGRRRPCRREDRFGHRRRGR